MGVNDGKEGGVGLKLIIERGCEEVKNSLKSKVELVGPGYQVLGGHKGGGLSTQGGFRGYWE